MATNKPMSDGGKGSVRRNEDNDAYRSNYDAIFGKGKKTMIEEEEHNDEVDYSEEEWTCDVCGGPMYSAPHWSYGKCDDCGATQELINDDYN